MRACVRVERGEPFSSQVVFVGNLPGPGVYLVLIGLVEVVSRLFHVSAAYQKPQATDRNRAYPR